MGGFLVSSPPLVGLSPPLAEGVPRDPVDGPLPPLGVGLGWLGLQAGRASRLARLWARGGALWLGSWLGSWLGLWLRAGSAWPGLIWLDSA